MFFHEGSVLGTLLSRRPPLVHKIVALRLTINIYILSLLSLTTRLRMHVLRQSGSRSGKHPDLPEYIATYRTQKKLGDKVGRFV